MSGPTFTPRKDLDQLVARMIVPNVQKVVLETEREAKRQAGPTKKWMTRGDAYVRRTHVAVHGEEIPDNLRFELKAYQWDVEHPGAVPVSLNTSGGHDMRDSPLAGSKVYLLEPRDSSPGHYVQIVHCRCYLEIDPNGVAKWVSSTPAKATGTTVRGVVYAKHKHVMGAEYGDVYPGGFLSPGTYFMHRTVGIMKARL
jgi:hypothetical protein